MPCKPGCFSDPLAEIDKPYTFRDFVRSVGDWFSETYRSIVGTNEPKTTWSCDFEAGFRVYPVVVVPGMYGQAVKAPLLDGRLDSDDCPENFELTISRK